MGKTIDEKIEELEAAKERVSKKIEKLKQEAEYQDDEIIDEIEDDTDEDADDNVIVEKKKTSKKIAAGIGIAALTGAGVFLAVKRPWQAAKVACHIVHIV